MYSDPRSGVPVKWAIFIYHGAMYERIQRSPKDVGIRFRATETPETHVDTMKYSNKNNKCVGYFPQTTISLNERIIIYL